MFFFIIIFIYIHPCTPQAPPLTSLHLTSLTPQKVTYSSQATQSRPNNPTHPLAPLHHLTPFTISSPHLLNYSTPHLITSTTSQSRSPYLFASSLSKFLIMSPFYISHPNLTLLTCSPSLSIPRNHLFSSLSPYHIITSWLPHFLTSSHITLSAPQPLNPLQLLADIYISLEHTNSFNHNVF